jgi:hypothetical protein
MTRRAALLLALAILVVAGAPAGCTKQVKAKGDICDYDMPSVYEACTPGLRMSPCESAPTEFAEACQLGCVMGTCGEKVHDCEKKPDPKWCGTSCADMRGGLFWDNLLGSAIVCEYKVGFQQPAWGECRKEYIEKRCPEIRGTPWSAQFPGFFG